MVQLASQGLFLDGNCVYMQKMLGGPVHCIHEEESKRLTPIAKYRVMAMDPKYAAVKGSRDPEIRCLT